MTVFTGTNGDDVATIDAVGTQVFTGWTGGTTVEWRDAVGDRFDGGDGNDSIRTFSGSDTLDGGGGNDSLSGGAGLDSFYGGAGNDTIELHPGDFQATETIDGGLNFDRLILSIDLGQSNFVDFRQATVAGIEYVGVASTMRTPSASSSALFRADQVGNGQLAVDLQVAGGQAALGSVGFDMGAALSLDISNFTFVAGFPLRIAITGDADSEFIRGWAWADNIQAGGGNDTIDSGTSDTYWGDVVDAGAGDDLVTWSSFEFASASVLGGDGIDTLRFTNRAAPTSFDLTARQFERAIGQNVDTASQWWSVVTDYYDAAWQKTNTDVLADDGRLVQTTFDVSPGGTGVNWQSITDYRSASGILTNQDGVFDNGTVFVKSLDYATGTAVDGIDDGLSEFTYFFRTAADRTQNLVLNVYGRYDDGRKFTQTNDIDGAFTWTYQTDWTEADGVTLDFKEIRWDDGTTEIIPY